MDDQDQPNERAGQMAEALHQMGFRPEQHIDDEDDWMFTAQNREQGSSQARDQLERDYVEPDDHLQKSRLSDTQTKGIPRLELMFRLFPEFDDQDVELLGWFLERHERATVAREGEGREEAVEVIKAKSGVGGSNGDDAPGPLMQQFIGPEEDEDE